MDLSPDQTPELAPGEQAAQDLKTGGFSDDEVDSWKRDKVDTLKAAGFQDEEVQKYFGTKTPDPSDMKAHVDRNLSLAKKSHETIDASAKPAPAEDFMDSLAAGWGNSVTGLIADQDKSPIALNDKASRMMRVAQMLGQTIGDVPAMIPGAVAGATIGAPVGGAIGSALGPLGTLGGIGVGVTAGGMAGANAAPAGIRKLLIDHYEKGDIKDAGDFMDRMSAASYEAIKQGAVGALTGVAGAVAKPVAGAIGAFTAELGTMATASAAMEKRLPNKNDFIDAGILMGGLHGATFAASKMMNIYKATGESPAEIAEASTKDPVLNQEMVANNPDMPKIELPSQEEQEKIGLKPVDADGKVIEDHPTEPAAQARQELEVAKEAQADQKPYQEETPEPPAPDEKLSDDDKYMLNFVGAKDVKPDDSTFAMAKRDLVKFWKNEDTGSGQSPGSEIFNKAQDELSNFWIKHFDYAAGLGKALKKVLADPATEKNPEALAYLHSEVQTKIKGFFDTGTRDFKTQDINGESYDKIRADYAKEFPDDPQMDRLRSFGMAARVVEKAKQGMKILVNTGTDAEGEQISPDRAQKILDQDNGTLELFNQRRINFRNRVLKYTHDAGFWTDDEFKSMVKQNESYMSFHRIQENDPLFGDQGSGTTKGVKKMKGVGGLIVDPMVSDIKDTAMLIKMAETNKVRQAMVSSLATGDESALLRKVDGNTKAVKVSADELSTELDKQDIDHDQDAVTGMTVFRGEQARNGPGRFEVHVDGERQVFEGDPQLIDIANRLNGNPTASGMFAGILRGASAGLRIGTISAPAFLLKHGARNQLSAATFSESGMLPIYSVAQHAAEFFGGKTERVQNFFNDGGAQSTIQAFDDNWIQSRIFDVDKKAPFFSKILNKMDTAAQLSHALILNNDNLIRFTEYSRLLDQGSSRVEAATGARRVLPDVQAAGLEHSFLLSQTAFLGIHAKGLMRSAEAVGDQWEQSKAGIAAGDIKQALSGPMIRALGTITMPTILLAAANSIGQNTDRIDRLEAWQKYGYWNYVNHSWKDVDEATAQSMPHDDLKRQVDGKWQIDNGTTFKLQMPFTQGVMFGGAVQASLDAWRTKSPKPFGDWIKNVAESTVALPIPNFAAPAIAQTTNYDAFTGRPVIPENKMQLAPELQYEPYTTESAKQIGKMVGYVGGGAIGPQGRKLNSPMVVEEYVRDWSGPTGMMILQAADKALAAAGVGKDKGESPSWEWADYPAIGAFAWRNGTAKTSNIDDFLDKYHNADSNIKSAHQLVKEGDPVAAANYREQHEQEMTRLSSSYKGIQTMKQYIQSITANPTYSGVEKRQLIDPVYYRMDEIAKMGNKLLDKGQ